MTGPEPPIRQVEIAVCHAGAATVRLNAGSEWASKWRATDRFGLPEQVRPLASSLQRVASTDSEISTAIDGGLLA